MHNVYRSGGIERSHNKNERPSPSISATVYPEGYKMIGNDGNLWEIHIDSRGTHRWVKSHFSHEESPAKEKAREKDNIKEAIDLLQSLGDDADEEVKEAIETLEALL